METHTKEDILLIDPHLNIAYILSSLTKARANWHPGNSLLLENQLFYKSGSFSAPNNVKKNDCYG